MTDGHQPESAASHQPIPQPPAGQPHATPNGKPAGLTALLTTARVGDTASRERAFSEVLRLLQIFVRGTMGTGLRSRHESMDICQSIAKSFVEDHSHGKLDFPSEAALVGYLKGIVRTKLAEVARRDAAAKRGGARGPLALQSHDDPSDPDFHAGPGQTMIKSESIDRFMSLFTTDELTLLRLRAAGQDWQHIAASLGKEPAALRKQYSRLAAKLEAQQSA